MPSSTHDETPDSAARSDDQSVPPAERTDAHGAPADESDLQAVVDHYERVLEARERSALRDGRPPSPGRQDRGPLARLARWLRRR